MTTCQYKCAPNRRHLLFSFKWIGHFSFSLNFSITFRTHTTPTSLSTVYYKSICWDSLGEKTHFYNFIHVSDLFPIFRWLRFKTNYSTTWNYGRFFIIRNFFTSQVHILHITNQMCSVHPNEKNHKNLADLFDFVCIYLAWKALQKCSKLSFFAFPMFFQKMSLIKT